MIEQFFLEKGISGEWATYLLSMFPSVEMVGSIPAGVYIFHLSYFSAIFYSLVGAFTLCLVLIFGLDWIHKHIILRIHFLKNFWNKRVEKLQLKQAKNIQKYGKWALLFFVALPGPGSGVWTGALVAWVFGIERRTSIVYIFFGSCISACMNAGIAFGFDIFLNR